MKYFEFRNAIRIPNQNELMLTMYDVIRQKIRYERRDFFM
jgi:hypothetical protein